MTSKPDNTAALPPRQVDSAGKDLLIYAPAKLNLNLLVGPRRPDGFHDLDSYIVKVSLYDRILLTPRYDGVISFVCSGADCGSDDKNLALRSARLLAEALPKPRQGKFAPGADIRLAKQIPPGKGLGGGSSDAAAVLTGLNQLWEMGLSTAQLSALAARLGSDVPLFLGPPAARMTGRGEFIEPATVHPFVAVLYLPELICPTAEVYRAFDAIAAESPQTAPWTPETPQLLSTRQAKASAISAQPPVRWRKSLQNDLAPAARTVCPELATAWDALAKEISPTVRMTGSGSALFILCDTMAEANQALADMEDDFRQHCCLVQMNPW